MQGAERRPHELGPVRADLDGGEVGAGARPRAHRGRRPCRPGRRTGRATGPGRLPSPPPGDLGPGQREGDELRALVLHRGAAVAHRRDGPRVPGGQHGTDRGERARSGVRAVDELVDGREPRPGHEVHERRFVVGRQQRRQLGVDRLPRGAAVGDQRGPQRGDDPLGVAVEHREGRCSAPRRHDGLPPLLHRALADPAHDGVDEPAGTRPPPRPWPARPSGPRPRAWRRASRAAGARRGGARRAPVGRSGWSDARRPRR